MVVVIKYFTSVTLRLLQRFSYNEIHLNNKIWITFEEIWYFRCEII